MARPKRVAFVTIGQSPRDDLVPELLRRVGPGLEPLQVGALDELTPAAIAALAPRDGDHTLVSRLRDGREVTLGKRWTERRLAEIMTDLDARDLDLIVLLCTGHFEGLHSRTLMIEAQRIVDHTVQAVAGEGRTVGVMVPLATQMDELHVESRGATSVVMAHASPYGEGRFEDAGRELGKTDLIVMHCIGYDEAMRRRVAAASGRPVLLARRLVAGAVAELIA